MSQSEVSMSIMNDMQTTKSGGPKDKRSKNKKKSLPKRLNSKQRKLVCAWEQSLISRDYMKQHSPLCKRNRSSKSRKLRKSKERTGMDRAQTDGQTRQTGVTDQLDSGQTGGGFWNFGNKHNKK